jgi:alpha-mannosidase
MLIEKLIHLTKTLQTFIYRDPVPLPIWKVYNSPTYDTPQPPDNDPGWKSLRLGDAWGYHCSWAWLTADITIPESFAGKPVVLHIELGSDLVDPASRRFNPLESSFWTAQPVEPHGMFSPPEAMVRIEGVPPQALNELHHEIWISEQAEPGQKLHIVMEAFTGISESENHEATLRFADLVWIDRDVEALYWDAMVVLDTVAALPEHASERGVYLHALDQAFHHINWLNPPDAAFSESVRATRQALQVSVFNHPSLSGGLAPRPVVHAVGHAHIDVAWLWPIKVTRGKAARTFATALALMEQFPSYKFTQSQPHLYKMVSEDYPDLFERIKERIKAGQWDATGATWVEMDTNIPSGEALVRQFLYGMRYFQRELGVRPEVLWLPDVFGYSAALPQIMRLAGVRYFYTSKLGWNEYTRYPYDTFWWEGLDGSRILTHLETTPDLLSRTLIEGRATYNARNIPGEIQGTWNAYQQQDANHHLITAYGKGDGGGGPTRGMIERMERMADLPGLPEVHPSTAQDFFHAVEETASDRLPRWIGELYFQMHRGTYTSQAHTKRNNRKTELLLHDAEALATTAYLLGHPYPHDDLLAVWETVMLNQFHDILPGSSIGQVYEDATRDYAQAQMHAAAVLDQVLEDITQHIRYDFGMQGFAVFNTLGFEHGGPIELTLQGDGPVEIVGPSGRPKAFQWLDRTSRRVLMMPASIPAFGHVAYAVRPADHETSQVVDNPVTVTPTRIENGLLRVDFDQQGNLVRIYDIEHFRDVLAPGEIGNQLWAYVDRPHHWDAWDIEAYVQDQGWPIKPEVVRVVEAGPLRATLEVVYRFNQSHITQRISMYARQRVLTFHTEVDWHEHHILLRTHFPLAIRAMNATYEVQFGTVQRPTHRNTAWDAAQHEVPAQQWADLSEAHYGVSLLNDCKYGYSAQDNTLTLSLLRSTANPDPQADQGHHTFTYALYPHAGDWRQDTIVQAKRLNSPLLVQPLRGGGTWLPVEFGLVKSSNSGVIIDTIKKAEDNNAVIVRVYEAHGGHTQASLVFATRIESAEEVNLLEEPIDSINAMVDTLRFSLTPYQIRSFRVKLGDILEHELG